jgi:hypothetical protein
MTFLLSWRNRATTSRSLALRSAMARGSALWGRGKEWSARRRNKPLLCSIFTTSFESEGLIVCAIHIYQTRGFIIQPRKNRFNLRLLSPQGRCDLGGLKLGDGFFWAILQK